MPASFVVLLGALATASALSPIALVPLGVVLGVYGAALVAGTVHAVSRRSAWDLAVVLPAVFSTVHLSQGVGLLTNLLGRWVRRS